MRFKRALAIIISIIMIFTYMPGNIVNAEEMPIEKVYMVATINDQMPTGLDDPDILRDRPAVGTEFYLWVLTSAVDELVGTDLWVNYDPNILSVADMDAVTDGIQPIMIPSGVNTANEVSISEVTAINTVGDGIIKYAASNKTPLNYPQGAVLLKSKFKVKAEIPDGPYFDFARPIELRGKLGSDNNPIRIIPKDVQPFYLVPGITILNPTAPIVETPNSGKYSASFDVEMIPTLIQDISNLDVWLQREDNNDYRPAATVSWSTDHKKLIARFNNVQAGDYWLQVETSGIYASTNISVQSIDNSPVINSMSHEFPSGFNGYGFEIRGQNLDKLSPDTVVELWKDGVRKAATNIGDGDIDIKKVAIYGSFYANNGETLEAGTYELRLTNAGLQWSETNGDRIQTINITESPMLYGWVSPDAIGVGTSQYDISFEGANLNKIDPTNTVVELWDWNNTATPFAVSTGVTIENDEYGTQGNVIAHFNTPMPATNNHYTAVIKQGGVVMSGGEGLQIRAVDDPVIYGFNKNAFNGNAPYMVDFYGYNLNINDQYLIKIMGPNNTVIVDKAPLSMVSSTRLQYAMNNTLPSGWYNLEVWHAPTQWNPAGWMQYSGGFNVQRNEAKISAIWNAAITANRDTFDLFVYGDNLQQLSGTVIELQKQDGTAVATTDMGNTNDSWYGVYPNDDGYSMSLNMRALDANGIPEYSGYKFAVYRMDGTNKVPVTDLIIEPGATIDATTEPYIGAHLRPWAIKSGLDYPINIEFDIENINNVEAGTKFIATLENGTTVITAKSVTLDVNDVSPDVTNVVDAYFEFSAANPLPQTSVNSGWKLHLYKNSVNSANLLRSNRVLYYIGDEFSIFDSAITPNTPGNTSYTLSFYGWNIQPGHPYTIKYMMPGESAERAIDITSTDGRSLEFVWNTSNGIPATGLVDGDYVFRIWDGPVKLHGEGFTIGNVVPPTVPPPPAGGSVDDVNDTYVFVPNTQYPLATDYEYSLDNGQTWKACTTTTIVVGNVALPAGYVQVRVKADPTSGISAGPAQMSDRAYTVNGLVTPPAPTGGIVNDDNNTFTFNIVAPYVMADYEYSIKGGVWTPCTTNVINVGNVALAVGDIRVRVRANATRNAGIILSNNQPYTEGTTGAVSDFTIAINNKLGLKDEEVTVSFKIDKPGLCSYDFYINYNPAVAKPIAIDTADTSSIALPIMDNITTDADTGKIHVTWFSGTGDPLGAAGTLFKVKFKITSNTITDITDITISNDDISKLDSTGNTVKALCKFEAGAIGNGRFGDVNGRDGLTATDALLLIRASFGKTILTKYQTIAADVNGRDGLTATDALLIIRKTFGKITSFPIENN